MRLALYGIVGVLLVGGVGGGTGCVRRTLTVTSDPPGSLVYLNDQEFGRTPVTRDFLWYGTYRVTLRQEGYETHKTTARIIAPWWQWPPIDLFAEIFPLKDQRTLSYRLTAVSTQPADPAQLIGRAKAMEAELAGPASPSTRPASSQPAR